MLLNNSRNRTPCPRWRLQQQYLRQAVPPEATSVNSSRNSRTEETKRIRKLRVVTAPEVAYYKQIKLLALSQTATTTIVGTTGKRLADSIVDARDIINARRRAQLADNSDHFQALSKGFDNIEYPKDFKPTNIQKYDGKQDPAQWL